MESYDSVNQQDINNFPKAQHTTESIYYTPWSYPCNVFVLNSIVVVSNSQKQSDVTPSNM